MTVVGADTAGGVPRYNCGSVPAVPALSSAVCLEGERGPLHRGSEQHQLRDRVRGDDTLHCARALAMAACVRAASPPPMPKRPAVPCSHRPRNAPVDVTRLRTSLHRTLSDNAVRRRAFTARGAGDHMRTRSNAHLLRQCCWTLSSCSGDWSTNIPAQATEAGDLSKNVFGPAIRMRAHTHSLCYTHTHTETYTQVLS